MKRGKRCLRVLLISALLILAFALPVSASSKPDRPKYFRVESQGDLSATLRWSRANGISGFTLYQYNFATKKYKAVKQLPASSYTCTIKNLKKSTKYRYILKAYKTKKGKKIYSSASDKADFTAKELSDSVLSIRRPRYTVTTKKNVTVLNKTTKKKVTLKKGTKLTVTAKEGNIVNGFLKNGDQISIKRSYLKYTGLDASAKKDYSKSLKEEFVNVKGYTSNTDWMIWVSEMTFKVNVYKGSRGKWKLVKSFPCCVGRWNARTSSGVRSILSKGTKWEYGGPWIYFTSGGGDKYNPEGCAFHAQPDKNMSKAVSHGCVRMQMSGLMYIYNNCPVGTRVVIY